MANSLKNKRKKNIKKFASFLHRISRDAYLDWQLSIILSLMIAIVLVGIGFVAFGRVEALSEDSVAQKPPQAQQKPIFDLQKFQAVLSNFDNRAAETTQLRKGYAGTSDPSL